MSLEIWNKLLSIKPWTITASAGSFQAMHALITVFEEGKISKESIDSTLEAYNNSCVEIRIEARDALLKLAVWKAKLNESRQRHEVSQKNL